MQPAKKQSCIIKRCANARADGHEHCWKHLHENSHAMRMTADMQSSIRSRCCDKPCTAGEKHDSGNQYCSGCKQACYWTSPSGLKRSA